MGRAVYYVRSAVVATAADNQLQGEIKLKEIIQLKVKLLEQLNSNLNFLLTNTDVKGKQIEQIKEHLSIVNQCLDQAMLLILLEEDEQQLNQALSCFDRQCGGFFMSQI